MIYFLYLIIAAVVVVFSIKVAGYVDLIEKKSTLSGAFIGGVILAAVTSLPELITSISSVMILKTPQPGLVLGNILGSNVFNLFTFGVIGMIFSKKLAGSAISKSHNASVITSLFAYCACVLTIFAGLEYVIPVINMSTLSIVLFILYIIAIVSMKGDTDDEEKEDTSPLSLKQVVFRFVLCAIGLVASSIAITYVTDIIAVRLDLGTTFAGALFLGIATSLPELSSSIALAKMGNFNALTGNIVGSNIFNFAILTFTDLIYRTGGIYGKNDQAKPLIFFGVVASIAMMLFIALKSGKKKITARAPFFLLSLIISGSYIAYLVFSVM